MLHKPILIIFFGLFFKELAGEDLKTKQELLPVVLSLGFGQNKLKLGSFPQQQKKLLMVFVPNLELYHKLKAWGKKEQENTVTNFVQSSVY